MKQAITEQRNEQFGLVALCYFHLLIRGPKLFLLKSSEWILEQARKPSSSILENLIPNNVNLLNVGIFNLITSDD